MKKCNFKEKFIYFPIHFESERSITDPAPFYTNQIEVITHIAKSLPAEFFLCVKEHPAQKMTGWKSIDFYKSIINLPNVKLLDPSISQKDILQKCSMVITIVGSTGIEALLHNKPVITFGETLYSNISSVNQVTDITDLPNMIRNSLHQQIDLEEINAFFYFLAENSFNYDFLGIQKFIEDNILLGGFLDSEINDTKLELLFREFESAFELVSDEFVKKINFFKTL